MGLKHDTWIRSKALSGMIDPFIDAQVHVGVVSYGLSSYGYDIRITDEFKVFTPGLGDLVVIDPKHIEARAMVDYRGDVCIIPPNSFALARSLEYLTMPKNVLGIVLGKSTYARCGIIVNCTPLEPCYSEDTEVLTFNGWKTFPELCIGEYILTRDQNGFSGYQPILAKQEYEYEGDMMYFDGRSIDLLVTPDHSVLVNHRIQRKDLEWSGWHKVQAKDVFGKYNYKMTRGVVWCPDIDLYNSWCFNYPIVPFLKFLGYYLGDGSSYKPKNGGYLIKLAAIRDRKRKYVTDILNKLGVNYNYDGSSYVLYSKKIFSLVNKLGHAHEKYIPVHFKMLPPYLLEYILDGLISSDGNRETMTYTTTSKRLADDVQEIIFKIGKAAIVRDVGFCDSVKVTSKHRVYKVRVSNTHIEPKIRPNTHKRVSYKGMVYDVTVPNHTLFVRRNGKAVWSGNCWHGNITIEISNTTQLPAKIYANEGIAQVLFFEGDAQCETTYADKNGKYQGQRGVTLPVVR